MQGEPWREKKQPYKRESAHRRRRMTEKEKREFRERMEASRGVRRRERWNAYGEHRVVSTVFSPATLARHSKRRGF